ncbi:MAG: fibronectin type III domain-containing protein, partial [Elusimicrobiota bacterium]|nr:fibronectin type III domain-containing protein [Elusimicrobiota bacterium]
TTSDSEGNDGGISMRVKYLGPGASVVVGAAWLGESESPYSWPVDIPLSPTDFAGQAQSSTTIKWIWTDNSGNEDGFEIRDINDSVILSSATVGLEAEATYYYQSGLTANASSHYYSIYSVNEEGYSLQYSSDSAFPVYSQANIPVNITALEVSYSSVTLNWGVNSNPAGTRYGLTYSTDSSFSVAVSTPLSLADGFTANTTDVVNLLSDTTYYFRTWAYNENDVMTDFSASFSTITLAVGVPQNFDGVVVSQTEIDWSWDAVSEADGYRIYSATDSSLVDDVAVSSYSETGLSTNTVYGRYVRAYIGSDESLSSNQTTYYTYASAPVTPSFSEVNYSSVTLNWQTSDNPGGTIYGLSYSTDSSFAVAVTTQADYSKGLTVATTDVINLTADTTYYFRIWAYNHDEIETAYVQTDTTTLAVGVPQNFDGVVQSQTEIDWSWDAVSGADGYRIYSATDSSLVADGVSSPYSETGLSTNTVYGRYVKAYIGSDESLSSNQTTYYTYASAPVTPSFSEVNYSSVTLNWQTSDN